RRGSSSCRSTFPIPVRTSHDGPTNGLWTFAQCQSCDSGSTAGTPCGANGFRTTPLGRTVCCTAATALCCLRRAHAPSSYPRTVSFAACHPLALMASENDGAAQPDGVLSKDVPGEAFESPISNLLHCGCSCPWTEHRAARRARRAERHSG